jgi:4-oxalocrotonate tautomerase
MQPLFAREISTGPVRLHSVENRYQVARGIPMPSMDIQVLGGVFSDDDKARLIVGVTRAFAQVAGETIAGGLSVRIHEITSGSWG